MADTVDKALQTCLVLSTSVVVDTSLRCLTRRVVSVDAELDIRDRPCPSQTVS